MITLPNVSLVCISGVRINKSIYALWVSSQRVRFAEVKFISPNKPKSLPKGIVFEKSIGSTLDTIASYSKYCIYNLHRHVDTDFCLLVQHDGFIIRQSSWRDDFLDYDYIGAPWPLYPQTYIDPFDKPQRVGNGGFSLRSKKLLTVPQIDEVTWEVNSGTFYKHNNLNLISEDGIICVHNRHIYERNGCKFAPIELAYKFSFEQKIPELIKTKPFGFHGQWPTLYQQVLNIMLRSFFYLFRRLL